jgi:hypothetical protein
MAKKILLNLLVGVLLINCCNDGKASEGTFSLVREGEEESCLLPKKGTIEKSMRKSEQLESGSGKPKKSRRN